MISFVKYPADPNWWNGGGFAKVTAALDTLIKPNIPASYEAFNYTDDELKVITDFKAEALQYIKEMEPSLLLVKLRLPNGITMLKSPRHEA